MLLTFTLIYFTFTFNLIRILWSDKRIKCILKYYKIKIINVFLVIYIHIVYIKYKYNEKSIIYYKIDKTNRSLCCIFICIKFFTVFIFFHIFLIEESITHLNFYCIWLLYINQLLYITAYSLDITKHSRNRKIRNLGRLNKKWIVFALFQAIIVYIFSILFSNLQFLFCFIYMYIYKLKEY